MIGVPLQRDPALGTRAYLTDEEFAQRQKQASQQAEADNEEFVAARTAEATGPARRPLGRARHGRSVRRR